MFKPIYDFPRNVPLPTSAEKHSLTPSVPEISMIVNNAPNSNNAFTFQERSNLQTDYFQRACVNKENVPKFPQQNKLLNHSDVHKQVRFHSPPVEKQKVLSNLPVQNMRNVLPDKNNMLPEMAGQKNRTRFADVYMANVPNRHLDLSIIDNSSMKNFRTQQILPQKEIVAAPSSAVNNDDSFVFQNIQRHQNQVFHNKTSEMSDIYNYKRNLNVSQDVFNNNANNNDFLEDKNLQRALCTTDITKASLEPNPCKNVGMQIANEEPTVKDLLKIIQQQNEQLLILQKQVSHLIEYQAAAQLNERPQRPITGPQVTTTDYYCQRQTNVFGDVLAPEKREDFKPKDKGPLSKFAIDVTTSFEVSVRRQQNPEQRSKPKEQKIQEILESAVPAVQYQNRAALANENKAGVSKSVNDLLVLDEQLPVHEDCPSPENSVHVDMNDYSSESEDDSSSSLNLDWTLYNNIMHQVNHILSKAQTSTDNCSEKASSEDHYKDETMKKVMEATVKHLKSVGIDFSGANNAADLQRFTEDTKKYTPTEISFAVKQLLMKYLPPDHLAKVACAKNNDNSNNRSEEMLDLMKKRPEFSFATLQYMKKYNLISDPAPEKALRQEMIQMQKPKNNIYPKILDITALKQQPKLL